MGLLCAKVSRGLDALFLNMPTVRETFEKTHKEWCREGSREVETDIREKVFCNNAVNHVNLNIEDLLHEFF